LPEETRICTSCGADNRVTARFCRECGAATSAAEQPSAASDAEPPTSTIPLPPPPVAAPAPSVAEAPSAPPTPFPSTAPSTQPAAEANEPRLQVVQEPRRQERFSGWLARNRVPVGAGVAALAAAVVVVTLLAGGEDGGSHTKPAPTTQTVAPTPPVPPDPTPDTTDADAELRAQQEDFAQQLTAMIDESREGFAATRAGHWSQAAAVRRRIVRKLDDITTSDATLEAIERSARTAMLTSAEANERSLACGDVRYVSDCAMPAHERARQAKERFRERFNRLLDELGEPTIKPRSF
jgi:hypothetical protein